MLEKNYVTQSMLTLRFRFLEAQLLIAIGCRGAGSLSAGKKELFS
jgi:hypothetical protein